MLLTKQRTTCEKMYKKMALDALNKANHQVKMT